MSNVGGQDTAGISQRLLVTPVRHLAAWMPRGDGRVVLLVAVSAYLTSIAVGRLVWSVDLWPYLGVPSRPAPFIDARNLTAAWECQRLGYDPLYDNPCDPLGRPLMYPRPWLLLSVLGLDQTHTFGLATVLVGAMFASFALLVGRVPIGTGFVLAVAACSPAVMFAVERGNMDVALFSLLAGSVLLWRVSPSFAPVLSPVLVLLAATAKIYPVFALPAFLLIRSRLAARSGLLCLAAFCVYAADSHRDIAHVAEIATQGQHYSYGARILPAHMYHQVGADHWAAPAALKQLFAALPLAIIAAAIVVRIRRRMGPSRNESATAKPTLLAFYAGALIYIGTFASANNFDYRLVFLLLTLPQLLKWVRMPAHRLSYLATVTLLAIVVLLWVGSLSHWLNLWDEIASWMVVSLLAAVVVANLPRAGRPRLAVLTSFYARQ